MSFVLLCGRHVRGETCYCPTHPSTEHSSGVFPPTSLLLAHCFLLEVGTAIATVFRVLIDTTFVRAATVAINDAIVCSHTPIHEGEYAHCIPNSTTNQHHNQGNGTPGLQLSHNIQFRFT